MFSTAVRFARLKVVMVAYLLQFPPVKGMPVYATIDGCDSLETHLALKLWHISQCF